MNIYELIEIAQAQTGRTTRMVDHAHNLALTGCHVVLLFPSTQYALSAQERYMSRYEGEAQRGVHFLRDSIGARTGGPQDFIFEDHSLVLKKIRGHFAELAQWDAPLNTNGVKCVGNPLGRVSEIVITREPEACK